MTIESEIESLVRQVIHDELSIDLECEPVDDAGEITITVNLRLRGRLVADDSIDIKVLS